MKKIILQKFLFFSSLMLCFSFITKATLYPFSSSFSGTQEVPVNASPGTGLISGVYNDATNTIFYTLTFSNLLAGTVAAHFHSPGAPGVSAGVIYGYTGFPTGVTSGTYTGSNVITETQETQLKTGLWYANIHSSSFPGGEIRSQITLGPATSLYTFTNTYSGAQENPPTPSTGTGTITGVFDPASHTIFYRVIFSGLLAPTAAAHFHAPALPGVNTAVIYAYTGFPTGVLTGTYSGKNTITALQETQLLAGLWYSNIHTTLYPGGEIRAQIGLQLAATITCPANIVTGNDAGHCAALVNFAATSAGVPSPALSYTLNNISIVSPYNFPVGTSTVHATATNTTGTAECNFTVTVNDNEAPHITNLHASPSQLWPPNNKMQDVTISYTSTDNCTGAVNCTLSVSSNEPGGSADYIITDEHHLKLRAQRNGNGNGRIYSVTVHCTDHAGNSSIATTTVTVAHDQSGKHEQDEHLLSVKVSPNPATNYFTVEIDPVDKVTKINVRLLNLSGTILEARNNITPGELIKIGASLKPAIYMLQVTQGQRSQQLKLYKQ